MKLDLPIAAPSRCFVFCGRLGLPCSWMSAGRGEGGAPADQIVGTTPRSCRAVNGSKDQSCRYTLTCSIRFNQRFKLLDSCFVPQYRLLFLCFLQATVLNLKGNRNETMACHRPRFMIDNSFAILTTRTKCSAVRRTP